jgi:outer membrane lipoprotein carrier protein
MVMMTMSPEMSVPSAVMSPPSVISLVITGQSRLDKDFTVEAEPDDNGLAVLRLYPKDPSPQLVEALLWVDKGTKLIKKRRFWTSTAIPMKWP